MDPWGVTLLARWKRTCQESTEMSQLGEARAAVGEHSDKL